MREFQTGDVVIVSQSSTGYNEKAHVNTLPQWLGIGSVFTITDKAVHHYSDGKGYKYQTTSPDNGLTWWLCGGCIERDDNHKYHYSKELSMSIPIRPYNIGDEVIMLTPVENYSCFVGGDVGNIVRLNEGGMNVDIRAKGERQQIDIAHIAHHSTKQTELFEGLTYG